ncbi:hypothetical protein [Cellulomonas triticagri]|uniref:Peptidase S9 n=1 Tax=Cellulomonas triticagri TaxID=2483352 RepID=A0A3M2J8A3_9CELL|nr:hypothetical protein [Cellulomonas triticagri]RMI06718.1 hypothetical protein EBM89_15500 [Cellulomonas triticagri]
MPTTSPSLSTTTPAVPGTRVLAAVVGGLATTAYYASPDVIRSRAGRGWAKAGLSAVIVAATLPDFLREQAAARAAKAERVAAGEETEVDWQETWDSMSTRGRVTAGAAAAGFLAVSAVSVVAIERGAFRRGERRRAEGVRWAHTRPAVVWGVVSTALALVPLDERQG